LSLVQRFDLASVTARLSASAPLERIGDLVGERAAVAAILAPRGTSDDAELLFIKRAEREGDPWSGHVAFPGGRHDPRDATIFDTAVRETMEEVGLDLTTRATAIGRLEDLPAVARGRRTGLVITPIIFALDSEAVTLAPNEEVAATLWVPLGQLARFEGAGTMTYRYLGKDLELPCLRLGEHVLWGLTYRMVTLLLEALKVPV
jgi:8-oxo-dGTP pyrophosphatase MutT (NUDIX family)